MLDGYLTVRGVNRLKQQKPLFKGGVLLDGYLTASGVNGLTTTKTLVLRAVFYLLGTCQ